MIPIGIGAQDVRNKEMAWGLGKGLEDTLISKLVLMAQAIYHLRTVTLLDRSVGV